MMTDNNAINNNNNSSSLPWVRANIYQECTVKVLLVVKKIYIVTGPYQLSSSHQAS